MPRVVVIDEDEPNRTLMREWLCIHGYEVVDLTPFEAHAGIDADLILLDLPRLRHRGRDRVRRVSHMFPGTPIVGLSTQLPASLTLGSKVLSELGVSQLLSKPSSREELLLAVDEVLASGS
jgi:CheY-like chemotaxis protein